MRRIEKYLKRFIGSLLALFLPRKRFLQIPLDRIRSILVVRQHNELGDMLCVVPLLRALRQHFPGARIDLMASPVNYAIMQHHPFVDEVLLYDKSAYLRSPREAIRFWRRLRRASYELAIVPSTVSMSFTSDLLAYLSGARYRIGAGSLNGIKNPARHVFHYPLDLRWDETTNPHQTERNLEYVRSLGIDTNDFTTVIGLTEEEKRYAAEFLSRNAGKKEHVIGFHPGAGKVPNRWPAERFAQVADRLASELDAFILITAGPMDDEPTKRMLECLRSPSLVLKEKNIRKVAAIIDRLTLYITNDTGMMHVAAATSTRVLALFGPSDPLQWAPKSERSRFLRSRDKTMTSLSEEEVLTAALEMIAER